jgi:hypothetical protein
MNGTGYRNFAIGHKLWTECGYDRSVTEVACEFWKPSKDDEHRCNFLGKNRFCMCLKAQQDARK